MKDDIVIGAEFLFEYFRNGKKFDEVRFRNKMTNEGLTYIADVSLSGATQITPFYVIIYENLYASPTGAETYATPLITECTAYTEATRPEWTDAGVTNKQLTNAASKAVFTFSATKTIYGGGIVGGGTAASTKGDAAGGGVLINVAYAGSGNQKSVESGDVLKASVTFTFASA